VIGQVEVGGIWWNTADGPTHAAGRRTLAARVDLIDPETNNPKPFGRGFGQEKMRRQG
jgi:hypothetical protein